MNKAIKLIISLILCTVIVFQPFSVSAASLSRETYVKEMILSYGKTSDEAKNWLTNNGYEILNYDLNEGADDIWSTKRAVYLGYKTTDEVSEAITDMRLMNMNGGYSVQDYQIMLDEQKSNIEVFLNDFIVSVNEYRTNYNNGQERAKTAYEMLNLLYDDDTQQHMGDLLLNKVKQEYSDEEWNALSAEEQSKIADMTTILMQANADAVLSIEQSIAMATDSGDALWVERYSQAETYDDMLDNLIKNERLTVNNATQRLAAEYDEDAKAIASKFEDYKKYLENYTSEDIRLTSSEEEIEAYQKENEDFNYITWFSAGTQYELISQLTNDGMSLLELMNDEELNLKGDDACMLYPLVSSLTKGQRACLSFLPMYQLITLGVNDDAAVKETVSDYDLTKFEEQKVSIYDGVDRSLFTGRVALTNDALRLQAATGKSAVQTMSDYYSDTTYVLWTIFGFSAACMAIAWSTCGFLKFLAINMDITSQSFKQQANEVWQAWFDSWGLSSKEQYQPLMQKSEEAARGLGTVESWSRYFKYAGVALTCVSLVILGISLWSTIEDMKEYYKSDFTPIPMYMVNESVNENDEKVFTYYTAVKCNRSDMGMITDESEILDDIGDINGDVGRQWVALYTTKDQSAGYPLTTDFTVQYENTNIPDRKSALSMFAENTAQNLTNSKNGYTYSDSKNGIYMFYGTDDSAYAGSIFSNTTYVLIGGSITAFIAVILAVVTNIIKKKKKKDNTPVKT